MAGTAADGDDGDAPTPGGDAAHGATSVASVHAAGAGAGAAGATDDMAAVDAASDISRKKDAGRESNDDATDSDSDSNGNGNGNGNGSGSGGGGRRRPSWRSAKKKADAVMARIADAKRQVRELEELGPQRVLGDDFDAAGVGVSTAVDDLRVPACGERPYWELSPAAAAAAVGEVLGVGLAGEPAARRVAMVVAAVTSDAREELAALGEEGRSVLAEEGVRVYMGAATTDMGGSGPSTTRGGGGDGGDSSNSDDRSLADAVAANTTFDRVGHNVATPNDDEAVTALLTLLDRARFRPVSAADMAAGSALAGCADSLPVAIDRSRLDGSLLGTNAAVRRLWGAPVPKTTGSEAVAAAAAAAAAVDAADPWATPAYFPHCLCLGRGVGVRRSSGLLLGPKIRALEARYFGWVEAPFTWLLSAVAAAQRRLTHRGRDRGPPPPAPATSQSVAAAAAAAATPAVDPSAAAGTASKTQSPPPAPAVDAVLEERESAANAEELLVAVGGGGPTATAAPGEGAPPTTAATLSPAGASAAVGTTNDTDKTHTTAAAVTRTTTPSPPPPPLAAPSAA